MLKSGIDLSIIISLSSHGHHDNITELYKEYKINIDQSGLAYEFIYVIDSESNAVIDEMNKLLETEESVKVVKLAKWFGESAALNAGFEYAKGEIILTLPDYKQIDSSEIPAIISSFKDQDMIVASRARVKDKFLHRLQSRIFHYLIRLTLGMHFGDLGCKVRIFRREVLEKIYLYGDQYRFLPLIANRFGFIIEERQVSSYFTDSTKKIYSFRHYTDRIVDLISIFFLIKFTKKPLRFFGFPGFIVFVAGCLIALYLFVERVIFDVGLADRPVVLVSILLIVFGIQLFAIGLVAEIIIFTHSKDSKDYIVEKIVNGRENNSLYEPALKIEEKVKV